MSTQNAMIQAAASIAAMMPEVTKRSMQTSRKDWLIYSVFHAAAKAAYLRAAQECLNAAYDAADFQSFDFDEAHKMIADQSVSLNNLIAMCQPGYAWGGAAVTL